MVRKDKDDVRIASKEVRVSVAIKAVTLPFRAAMERNRTVEARRSISC